MTAKRRARRTLTQSPPRTKPPRPSTPPIEERRRPLRRPQPFACATAYRPQRETPRPSSTSPKSRRSRVGPHPHQRDKEGVPRRNLVERASHQERRPLGVHDCGASPLPCRGIHVSLRRDYAGFRAHPFLPKGGSTRQVIAAKPPQSRPGWSTIKRGTQSVPRHGNSSNPPSSSRAQCPRQGAAPGHGRVYR